MEQTASLYTVFKPYLDELGRFHFSFTNPLFWVGILLLFFILLRFWNVKKAFSFSLITAAVFLAATVVEGYAIQKITTLGGEFDPLIVRIMLLVVVIFIACYYVFIRD